MDDDDRQIGRLLTRREVVAILGAGSGALIVAACVPSAISTIAPSLSPSFAPATGTATAKPGASAAPVASLPSCVVKPELAEGPFFVDEKIERSDVRSDTSSGTVEEGVTLALTFAVAKVSGNTCAPFEGALVDVWHCDAEGAYSDVQQEGTAGQDFLRGYQVSDANGRAAFTTIYPGWYGGRTVHIHFKIRTDPQASSGLEFTSQLFFDEGVTAEVYAQEPYASRGSQDTTNAADSIYGAGGSQLLLVPARSGSGYAATFDIGVVV
jgi:protocatechuate 3,4-dioxygenase beta subunit